MLNYNLLTYELELYINGKNYVLPGYKLEQLILGYETMEFLEYYFQCSRFTIDNAPMNGLCEVVADGKVSAVMKHYVEVQKASL